MLEKVWSEGEAKVSSTQFMQSTHKTIASLLVIPTKAHGYNMT